MLPISKKTIAQIQDELTKSNIDFSDIIKRKGKKKDYVERYVESVYASKKEEQPSVKEEKREEEKREELIMTLVITGHGCEDLTNNWNTEEPIGNYFRDKVRVYSSACVPDVASLSVINDNRPLIYSIQNKLSAIPENETGPIIQDYADEVRSKYQDTIRTLKIDGNQIALEKGFDKIFENVDKASNLTTYLSNKTFYFYNVSANEKITPYLKETIGIHVADIRLKITSEDGEVRYSHIFNAKSSKTGLSYCNLIYKDGLTNIIKNVLKMKDWKNVLKDIQKNFGFDKSQTLDHLSLEQLYYFFKLANIEYVNIMDFTCRSCSTGRLSKALTDTIYEKEQKYKTKPVAFGLKTKKRSHKRSNKSKRIKKIKSRK